MKILEASYKSIYKNVSRLNANITAGYTDFFSILIGVQLKVLKCLN